MEYGLMFGGITCGTLVVIGGMAAMVWLFVIWMGRILRKASGWDDLVRRFPGDELSPEPLQRTSIRLGNVLYRFGAQVAPTPEGLYLAFKGVYKNPPLLIPWSAINKPHQSNLFWQNAWTMDIGDPPVTRLTVKNGVFESIKASISG